MQDVQNLNSHAPTCDVASGQTLFSLINSLINFKLILKGLRGGSVEEIDK